MNTSERSSPESPGLRKLSAGVSGIHKQGQTSNRPRQQSIESSSPRRGWAKHESTHDFASPTSNTKKLSRKGSKNYQDFRFSVAKDSHDVSAFGDDNQQFSPVDEYPMIVRASTREHALSMRQSMRVNKLLSPFILNYFDVFRIFLFEFIGTATLAYGVNASRNSDVQIAAQNFVIILFCIDISGSHFNPVVTLINVIKQKDPLPIPQALLQLAGELSGGFVGAALACFVLNQTAQPQVMFESTAWLIADVVGEVIATGSLVFFIMYVSHSETSPVSGRIPITSFIVAVIFFSRKFSPHTGGCLNPGLALSLATFQALYSGSWAHFANIWVLFVGPFTGGIVGLLLFEGVYIKYVAKMEE